MTYQTSLSRRKWFAGIVLSTVLPLLSIAADPAPKKKAPSPVLQPIEDVAGLPRVLLIGDSISMGYTLPVREKLAGVANVHRPPTNCGATSTGIDQIESWLTTGGEGKKWDVIHFNWGLHDLKYLGADNKTLSDPADPSSHQMVSPDDYRKNLETLVARLQKTGAKLIWRNTTPVPAGSDGRKTEDVVRYNAIAAEVMEKAGIPTHDLYSFALGRLDQIQLPMNVHYSPEGYSELADEVARVVREALKP